MAANSRASRYKARLLSALGLSHEYIKAAWVQNGRQLDKSLISGPVLADGPYLCGARLSLLASLSVGGPSPAHSWLGAMLF